MLTFPGEGHACSVYLRILCPSHKTECVVEANNDQMDEYRSESGWPDDGAEPYEDNDSNRWTESLPLFLS